jgi:hypothetical protein
MSSWSLSASGILATLIWKKAYHLHQMLYMSHIVQAILLRWMVMVYWWFVAQPSRQALHGLPWTKSIHICPRLSKTGQMFRLLPLQLTIWSSAIRLVSCYCTLWTHNKGFLRLFSSQAKLFNSWTYQILEQMNGALSVIVLSISVKRRSETVATVLPSEGLFHQVSISPPLERCFQQLCGQTWTKWCI